MMKIDIRPCIPIETENRNMVYGKCRCCLKEKSFHYDCYHDYRSCIICTDCYELAKAICRMAGWHLFIQMELP